MGLEPYFNDYVVHQGHAYGFDGSHLAAIDLADGERVWKGGRYGNGQLILLADQDVLLTVADQPAQGKHPPTETGPLHWSQTSLLDRQPRLLDLEKTAHRVATSPASRLRAG